MSLQYILWFRYSAMELIDRVRNYFIYADKIEGFLYAWQVHLVKIYCNKLKLIRICLKIDSFIMLKGNAASLQLTTIDHYDCIFKV